MEHIETPNASEVKFVESWETLGSPNDSGSLDFGSCIVLQVLISPH